MCGEEKYLFKCRNCSVLRDYFTNYFKFVDDTKYNVCKKCCANEEIFYKRYVRQNNKKWVSEKEKFIKHDFEQ